MTGPGEEITRPRPWRPGALPALTVVRLQPCGHPTGDVCGCGGQQTVDRIELAAAPVVWMTAGRAAA